MFKKGDKLKCKNSSRFLLETNKIYEIEAIYCYNNEVFNYYIICDDFSLLKFTDEQLSYFFYIEIIIRRRKLEQLNSL